MPELRDPPVGGPDDTSADGDPLARIHVAQAALLRGDVEEAVGHYRTVLERAPGSVAAYYAHQQMAYLLRQRGFLNEAIEHYRAALEIDASHFGAHFNLGSALLDRGELDDADEGIARCRAALELAPSYVPAHMALGRGLSDRGRGGDDPADLDAALEHYRAALASDPQAVAARCGLGRALLYKGDVDAAIAECRAALPLDPQSEIARENLGAALLAKGDLDGALAELRVALSLNARSATVHMNLAEVLARKGLPDQALPHDYRLWCLHRAGAVAPGLRTQVLLRLARVFTERFDAPVLALQVLSELLPTPERGAWAAAYRRTVDRCRWLGSIALRLGEDETLAESERLEIQGILVFHLGDPAQACALLDRAEEVETGGESTALQYYLARSADAVLADERDAIRRYAEGAAERACEDPQSSAADLYYAGLLLLEGSPAVRGGEESASEGAELARSAPLRALRCFERCVEGDPSHLPARYMKALCLQRLARADDLRAEVLALLEWERAALVEGGGFIRPLEPVALGLELRDWRQRIRRVVHAGEIADAVQLVRVAVAELEPPPPVAKVLELRPSQRAHAVELFRAERALEDWFAARSAAEDAREADLLRDAHPSDCGPLDELARKKVDVERWLGRECYRLRGSFDPNDAFRQIRYALLRHALDPRAAITLGYYVWLLAQGERPQHAAKAWRAGLYGSLGALATQPLKDPLALGMVALFVGTVCAFAELKGSASEGAVDYEAFRAELVEWVAVQRRALGAERFDATYPVREWLQESAPA